MPRDLSGMANRKPKPKAKPKPKPKPPKPAGEIPKAKPTATPTSRPEPRVIKASSPESEKKVIEALEAPPGAREEKKGRGWPKGKPRKEAGVSGETLAPKLVEMIKTSLKTGHQILFSIVLTKFIYKRPTQISEAHAKNLTEALWQILDPWFQENVGKVGKYTIPLVVYLGLVGATFVGQGVEEIPDEKKPDAVSPSVN